MAERRAEGVRLLQAREMSQAQIARNLGVSEATISKWKQVLEESERASTQDEFGSKRAVG